MKKTEQNNSPLIILSIIVVAFIIYIAQKDNNISPDTTNVAIPQNQNDSVKKQPVVKETTDQSLQNQCEINSKSAFNIWSEKMKQTAFARVGSDSVTSFDYSSHYNKSMSKCFVSIHARIYSAKFNVNGDYFYLVNSNDSVIMGQLFLASRGSEKVIMQCLVNSLPCASVEEYVKLVFPYLNN